MQLPDIIFMRFLMQSVIMQKALDMELWKTYVVMESELSCMKIRRFQISDSFVEVRSEILWAAGFSRWRGRSHRPVETFFSVWLSGMDPSWKTVPERGE